jgi:hypothetical protein
MERSLGVTPRPGLAALALVLVASAASAQEPQQPPSPPDSGVLREPLRVSPGGAFLRAVLVPGWGHAAIGSYTRGGFYFAFESGTAYAFSRTRHRLSEARERAALRESVLRGRLADEGVTDPDEIQSRLDGDVRLGNLQDLVKSREGQQEDLVAFGIFLLFLSGADAYVSAHLARFPEPIQVEVTPVGSERAEVSLSIPLPNF